MSCNSSRTAKTTGIQSAIIAMPSLALPSLALLVYLMFFSLSSSLAVDDLGHDPNEFCKELIDLILVEAVEVLEWEVGEQFRHVLLI